MMYARHIYTARRTGAVTLKHLHRKELARRREYEGCALLREPDSMPSIAGAGADVHAIAGAREGVFRDSLVLSVALTQPVTIGRRLNVGDQNGGKHRENVLRNGPRQARSVRGRWPAQVVGLRRAFTIEPSRRAFRRERGIRQL